MEGKVSAISLLQKQFGGATIGYLINAGALQPEAAEVVGSLWADILTSSVDRAPRLSRYDGSCALQTWLNTVALNKLLTRKRGEERWNRLIPTRVGSTPENERGERENAPTWLADPETSEPDDAPLLEIMRLAVEAAFLSCEPEDFVLLQLAHRDNLRGTELAVMFKCDASVISRRLQKAEEHIAATTLLQVRRTDPWLELRWEDFLELCRSATPGCLGLD
jgi:DNA-directed RNA polymerase specialized sigma24 family protein